MMRMVLLLSLLLSGAVVATTVQEDTTREISTTTTTTAQQNEREMQIDFGELVCPLIENALQNQVDCTCEMVLDLPLVGSYADVTCARNVCEPLAGVVCGDIELFAKVKFGGVSFSTGICLDNISLFGTDFENLGPFCLDYDLASAGRGLRKTAVVQSCTAKLAGTECTSCTKCDRFGGVKFDCSNVSPSFKTNTCTKFRPYLSRRSSVKPSASIPKITLSA